MWFYNTGTGELTGEILTLTSLPFRLLMDLAAQWVNPGSGCKSPSLLDPCTATDRVSELPTAVVNVYFYYDSNTGLYASANNNLNSLTRVVSPLIPSHLLLLNRTSLKSGSSVSKPVYGV